MIDDRDDERATTKFNICRFAMMIARIEPSL
jgi:hypothetical protein